MREKYSYRFARPVGMAKSYLAMTIVALSFVVLAARFFRLIDRYCVNVFFNDQWQLADANLFQKHSWLEIFRWQHGLHRQGIGGLLLAFFEPLVRWNSRADAFLIASVLACACAAALWLKQRMFGSLAFSDVIIPLLFFTPVQWGIFLGALNPSYAPLPLLLMMLFCLGWTSTHRRIKYVAVLSANFFLIYCGYGLLMGFLTPVLLTLHYFRSRDRAALLSALLAVALLGSFFIGYHYDPGVDRFQLQLRPSFFTYFGFIILMFARFVQIESRWVVPALFIGGGLAFATVLVVADALRRTAKGCLDSTRTLIVFALLSFALLFCGVTAYGRAFLGAPAPRYMNYLILAFLGLYFASLSIVDAPKRQACVWSLLLLSAFGSLRIGAEERRMITEISGQRRAWKACYLRTHQIQACDASSGMPIGWEPEPEDLQYKLDFLEKRRLNLFAE